MAFISSNSMVAALLFVASVCMYYHVKRRSLKSIRGPPSPSWLVGHEMVLRYQDQVGDCDFQWIRDYGTAWRTSGCYGEDILMVADPAAMQYVFHTSAYRYEKPTENLQSLQLITGRGMLSVSAVDHQRHKRVMSPAFSETRLRQFLPLFRKSALRLNEKLQEQLKVGAGEKVINVFSWVARTTLDIIGEAAFDYRFGALDNSDVELARVFNNLFSDSVLRPTVWDPLFRGLWRYIPRAILQYVEYLPTRDCKRFRNFLTIAKATAKELLEDNSSDKQENGHDVLSVLVQSNQAETAKRKLDEDEVLSQMTTVMLAGNETSASAISWLLWELAKHPEDQQKLRNEIKAIRTRISARGDTEYNVADLDGMAFSNAVIKEALRLHPIAMHLYREAGQDDIIPLSHQIRTTSGEDISEIVVRKGQIIRFSVCGYNRLPSVWGNDADKWNPTRFMDAPKPGQTTIGLHANLMTFSGGVRGCLGWRFALLEMQAIMFELIETFDFAPPSDGVEIQRVPAFVMIPMVRGDLRKGTQLPLTVSFASKDV